MKCPYCGAEADPSLLFCTSCGRKLRETPPPDLSGVQTAEAAAGQKPGRALSVALIVCAVALLVGVIAYLIGRGSAVQTAETGAPQETAVVEAAVPTNVQENRDVDPDTQSMPEATEPPTQAPAAEPTQAPTSEPTEAPTQKPTRTSEPTEAPTQKPTQKPTPTPKPTQAPTPKPTEAPTAAPAATATEGPMVVYPVYGDLHTYRLKVGERCKPNAAIWAGAPGYSCTIGDSSIVSVSSSGVVTALSAGTTTVTYSAGGMSQTYTIIVE